MSTPDQLESKSGEAELTLEMRVEILFPVFEVELPLIQPVIEIAFPGLSNEEFGKEMELVVPLKEKASNKLLCWKVISVNIP